jgi:hypothetical protein
MAIFHGPLHLEKLRSVQWKVMDTHTSVARIIIFFDIALMYGDVEQCLGYTGKSTEHCVKFYNFVKCLTCVNHLTSYY